MDAVIKTSNIETNRYHTLTRIYKYGVAIPVTCGTTIFSNMEYIWLAFGTIPEFWFPKIKIDIVKQEVKIDIVKINIDQPKTQKELIIRCLMNLYDKQMDAIAEILYNNTNIKEKYLYKILFIDDDGEIKRFEKDIPPCIPIYATFDRKTAHKVYRQYKKSFGFRKTSMCKMKINKLINKS